MKRSLWVWTGLVACVTALAGMLVAFEPEPPAPPREHAAAGSPDLLVARLAQALDGTGAPAADPDSGDAIASAVRAALVATAPGSATGIAAARNAAEADWVAASGWRDPGEDFRPVNPVD